jgi:hypothetical protein
MVTDAFTVPDVWPLAPCIAAVPEPTAVPCESYAASVTVERSPPASVNSKLPATDVVPPGLCGALCGEYWRFERTGGLLAWELEPPPPQPAIAAATRIGRRTRAVSEMLM